MATPLIGAAIAEPVPVPATDGRTHLAYELQLTNALGGNATLDSLTVSAGDRKLLTLSGDNLTYWTRALGNPTPTNVLGPGQTGIVWLDVAVDGGAQVPTDLTHSVHVKVAKPLPGLRRRRRHPGRRTGDGVRRASRCRSRLRWTARTG